MAKKRISVLKTLFEGLKVYLYNLDVFMKYLSFPVLGSVLGIFVLFLINYLYIVNLGKIQDINPIFQNVTVDLTLLIILTLPAFVVIIKALIDYVVAFGAVNSMCVMGTKRISDVYTHKEVIKRRFAPYCVLVIVLSLIFGAFSLILPLLIISLIFLSLAVQIFTLEENTTPYEAIRMSIEAVKENFWTVTFVLLGIFLISYVALPYLISWFVGTTPVMGYLIYPVEKYLELMPINDINLLLQSSGIQYSVDVVLFAENIVYMTISSIVVMYMLPFRSACCVYLYKNLVNNKVGASIEEKESKKEKKSKKERKEK